MDKVTQFAQAFYGGNIPSSQTIAASQSVMNMITALKNDLRNKLGETDEKIMNSAILSACGYMNTLSVSDPSDYLRNSKLGIKVFNYALEAIREAAPISKDDANPSDLIPVRDRILSAYKQWVDRANAEGIANPKLHAWKNLVDQVRSRVEVSGYTYYLLHWKIPVDEGFFGTEPYIAMSNADPSLPDREPIRMEINGQKWNGKLG